MITWLTNSPSHSLTRNVCTFTYYGAAVLYFSANTPAVIYRHTHTVYFITTMLILGMTNPLTTSQSFLPCIPGSLQELVLTRLHHGFATYSRAARSSLYRVQNPRTEKTFLWHHHAVKTHYIFTFTTEQFWGYRCFWKAQEWQLGDPRIWTHVLLISRPTP